MKAILRCRAFPSLAMALSIIGGIPAAAAMPGGEVTAGAPDPALVNGLASSLEAALAKLSATASRADIEAAIVYTLDQSQQPVDVQLAALAGLKKAKLTRQVAAVRDAVSKQRGSARGTGATGGTGGTRANNINSVGINSVGIGGGPTLGSGGGTDYSGRR